MKRPTESDSQDDKRTKTGITREMTFEEELEMMEVMNAEKVGDGDDDFIAEGVPVTTWQRPKLVRDPQKEDLTFQWMDIDLTDGQPLPENPAGGPILGASEGPVPILRLYGVTKCKSSVMVSVHGFTPYIFACFREDIDLSEKALGKFRSTLDAMMKEKSRNGTEKLLKNLILQVERVDGLQSLQGYHFEATRSFVKIYVAMPSLVNRLRSIIDATGVNVDGYGLYRGSTYESNVPFILRYMIDRDIQGSDWLECPKGTYSVRRADECVSRCTLEADIYFDRLKVYKCEGPWSSIAPLRILSFDIECQGRKGHFPEAELDPVIQIANTVTLQGSDQPIIRNVFTLNTCLPIVGARVYSSQTESEMLMKWKTFVCETDPDVLTGYNIGTYTARYDVNTI
jgi:DNA polymerase delta subunit 1